MFNELINNLEDLSFFKDEVKKYSKHEQEILWFEFAHYVFEHLNDDFITMEKIESNFLSLSDHFLFPFVQYCITLKRQNKHGHIVLFNDYLGDSDAIFHRLVKFKKETDSISPKLFPTLKEIGNLAKQYNLTCDSLLYNIYYFKEDEKEIRLNLGKSANTILISPVLNENFDHCDFVFDFSQMINNHFKGKYSVECYDGRSFVEFRKKHKTIKDII